MRVVCRFGFLGSSYRDGVRRVYFLLGGMFVKEKGGIVGWSRF